MAEVPYDDIFLNITSKLNTKGISDAVDALKGLQSITGFSGLKQAGEDLKDFLTALDGISNKRMRAITNLASSLKGLGSISKAMKATKELAEIENPLNDTSMSEGQPPVSLSDMMKSFEVNMTWKDILKNAFDEARENGTSALAYLGDGFRNFASKANTAVGNAIAKMKEFGKAIKNVHSPLDGLLKRFKNLIIYRAMRAIISGIVNGLKEGIKNLEDWDRSTGMTGFAESMDRARESLLVLKNSLAVITAPALEWLIGVLQKVATWAMTASNAISRFFAILGGKSTYRAVIWADTLAESEAKAGGSANKATAEFKKQLMAFDEINNLTAPNEGGSGGGGGGGSGAKYTEMFEERDVGNVSDIEGKLAGVVNWLKQIAEFLSKGLAPLAKIKDTVQEVWNKIKETASLVASAFKKPIETIVFGFRNVISAVSSLFESIISLAGSVVKSVLTILDAVIKVGDEFGIWQTLATWIKGAFDILAGAIQVVAYWIKTAGYYLEYVATLAGEAWKLIMGKGSIEEFKRNMEEAKNTLENKVIKATNDLANALNNTFNRKYYLRTEWDEIINRTIHVNEVASAITGKGYTTTYKYASGGFPTTGQLFIAREAGAEMVGQIGGHTAVANNQDIVASVSQGVASAVASVLGGGSNVTVTLEGDAKGIFKVVQKEGRAYSARTGQPALA